MTMRSFHESMQKLKAAFNEAMPFTISGIKEALSVAVAHEEELLEFKMMGNPDRISLTDLDFQKLVAGEILQKGKVLILLQDIGYSRMREIINNEITNPRRGQF